MSNEGVYVDFRVFEAEDHAVTIDLNEVVFIKYVNRRTYFHTTTQIYYLTSTIKSMANLTADLGFVQIDSDLIINVRRINEGIKIVNVDHLTEFQVFVDGIGYSISRRRLASLRESIQKYSK